MATLRKAVRGRLLITVHQTESPLEDNVAAAVDMPETHPNRTFTPLLEQLFGRLADA
ncbi:hypothetical protein [Pseudarthrobacter sp. NamE5]|uniref:hypothetical protein n=1 Tax=Pseudarthrobacter sp. NamE5 TaxID=2576839 RepID=UPI001F11311D|nr:hypothetical protein [Pseudarthrobacter sp. NamE5]